MKNLIFSIIICLFIHSLYSQSVPQGMKYQAVARDLKGEVIANQQVSLKIQLQSNEQLSEIYYSENHELITNQFGLFSLVIGEGLIEKGDFSETPWNTQDIWIQIAIKLNGETSFTTISKSKLLTVPYAFHAGTANELASKKRSDLNSKVEVGVPSQNWSLFGNSKSDPDKDKLGTTDNTDLVFVTNNEERLRITANGEIMTGKGKFTIGGNLEVQGDKTNINKDLYVGRNVYLNNNKEFDPRGFTINYGDFTVENNSFTKLTGDLEVAGNSQFDAKLNTDGDFSISTDKFTVKGETGDTYVDGTQTVKGDGQFDAKLNTDGDFSVNTEKFTVNAETGNTHVDGTHYVKGESTFEGLTSFTTINVSDNVPDGDFLATFENTNNGTGDGIRIKLGKARAETGLPANSDTGISQNQIDKMKDLIGCELGANVKLPILKNLVIEGIQADIQVQANMAIGIGNLLIDFINTKLEIPRITVFPEWGWSYDFPLKIGTVGFTIPEQKVGPIDIPDIPGIDLSGINIGGVTIEGMDLESLEFWGIPDICLSDIIPNPLNYQNEFIQFSDMENNPMGAIRAESVVDWSQNYLNPSFMLSLRGAYINSIDKKHGKYHFKGKINEAIDNYKKIGVEYSSGNGDYAEWLERANPNEVISFGDIVAVKAGKITKDLSEAEQVMAVSHRPIVLGNVPPNGKNHLGNNIAFMGQIPVKVMGPVTTGDYIVGNSKIPGYGIAISSKDMTIEDFKFSVGRAWEDNSENGPKMVNTVIGVHNGDYINILKRYEEKFRESESRLESVEAKIDALTGIITPNQIN